jgi:hypothetical protein
MRYLLLTYYKKPDGKIDEAIEVSKRIRSTDLQTANVILDFKKLEVVKASMGGTVVPRDWERIISYYYQHYPSIIERLFNENGYKLVNTEESVTEDEATRMQNASLTS